MSGSQQLTLNIGLRDGLRFSSFYCAKNSSNAETLATLQGFISSPEAQQIFLWGKQKSGKTHLLQASCAEAYQHNMTVSYIPLKMLAQNGPGILTGINQAQLVVIDDIDCIIGDRNWETAFFNLINQIRSKGHKLLISATQNPRHLDCVLPDLASRLIWGGSYQIHELSDADRLKALQARAEQRGFKLSDRVIDYLFRRYPRDIETLMDILNTLDKESLRKKTLITVPFVKQVLEER